MAAMNEWQDYAILTPSKGGKPWKVQINGDGAFRCSCPAFIFSKGIKTCKHTRKCVEAAQGGEPVQAPVIQRNPWVEEATKATDAMLRAGRLTPDTKAISQMVEVLAARLRNFHGGAQVTVTQATTVTVGVRQISFED